MNTTVRQSRVKREDAPFLVALIAVGVLASPAGAAPASIYNLGTLNGALSRGAAINDAGQVAGWSYVNGTSEYHAFRYSGVPGAGGAMQDLGVLPDQGISFGHAINNSGQVAGFAPGLTYRAFLYTGTPGAGGRMADLGTLDGFTGAVASGINDAGQVVGAAITVNNERRAFLYTGTPGAGGAMVDLGSLGGGQSGASAINASGQVVGSTMVVGGRYHAFLYTGVPGAGGTMHDLGTLDGSESVAEDVNASGQVVGEDISAGGEYRAFLYQGTPGAGGAMTRLASLGGSSSVAFGNNDAGVVVGDSLTSTGQERATLWQTDAAHTPVNLDAWLDANSPAQGAFWTLTQAQDINNNGQVTGWGDYDDGPGGLTDGTRAFLLDASSLVPERAGLALPAIGGLTLFRRRGRVRGRSTQI
jgi:probable HAF family extracellular repeat protein